MPKITKNIQAPYYPQQMFNLVNNFCLYPEFLPWCNQAIEIERQADYVIATLTISKGPFNKSFTTKNYLAPHQSITMELVDGPFKLLNGAWNFAPIEYLDVASNQLVSGTAIDFVIEFEFSNRMLAKIAEPIFYGISNSLVDAFLTRAHKLYS